ncbi:MAG: hypothetical protein PHC64_02980 [Candidatus Gastranaerophilales bacterium]|nr:hypothetical protein [Candidatus Gastranaerophilales bacterium]
MRVSANYCLSKPALRTNNNKQPIRKDVNFTGWGKNIKAPCLLVCDIVGTLDFGRNWREIVKNGIDLAKKRNAYVVYATGGFNYNDADFPQPDFLISRFQDGLGLTTFGTERSTREQLNLDNKADVVEILRERLNIPWHEVIMAGDDLSDKGMAKLAEQERAYFVAPENLSPHFADPLRQLAKKAPEHIIVAEEDGAEGVFNGLQRIIEARTEAEKNRSFWGCLIRLFR